MKLTALPQELRCLIKEEVFRQRKHDRARRILDRLDRTPLERPGRNVVMVLLRKEARELRARPGRTLVMRIVYNPWNEEKYRGYFIRGTCWYGGRSPPPRLDRGYSTHERAPGILYDTCHRSIDSVVRCVLEQYMAHGATRCLVVARSGDTVASCEARGNDLPHVLRESMARVKV